MADEQVIKEVIVRLSTQGDVRPGLEEAERAAETSQRRIDATSSKSGSGRGMSASQFLGLQSIAEGRAPFGERRGPSMQETAAARKMLGLDANEAKTKEESNRQTGLFNRSIEQSWRGLDKVSRATTGFGVGGGIMGAGGPIGIMAAGMVAGIATTKQILGITQSTVALTDPGRAYRLERAQMDLQASIGRGLIPLHDRMERATRSAADWAAAHPGAINRVANLGLAIAAPGLRYLEAGANWLGSGNENKSRDMAINPELGRTFGGGDELYRAFAERAILSTPANQGGGADKIDTAADKMQKASEDLLDFSRVLQSSNGSLGGFIGALFGQGIAHAVLK